LGGPEIPIGDIVSSISRRDFIATSAASVVVASTRSLDAEAPAHEKPWYTSIARCGHLNLNERDPLTLDCDAWMDYFASLKIDTVLHNGGGIMAFYPTEVPFHRRSKFLGSRDVLGELMKASRERGIRVVARMDPNYAYEDAFHTHPEWFERNADESPRRHAECPWLYKTCMFSTYFTEQMPAIYREIAQRYAPECFYTNGWPGTQALEVCYCANCREIYREKTGGVPPQGTDPRNPVYRKYYEIYMGRIAEVWKKWEDTIRETDGKSGYVGNLGGGIRTVKNVKQLSDLAQWFYADYQGRSTESPIWLCAQQGRVARCAAAGRTAVNAVGAYDTGTPGWRHASKTAEETTLWMAQDTASGMIPCFHWLGGKPDDTRWRETGRKYFQWIAKHEEHFRNRESIADIAILYPQSTISFYGATGKQARTLNGGAIDQADFLDGMYEALLQGRFVFDFVHQDNLSETTLRKYKVLVIPNAAYLSDSECDAIRAYAAAGGSVLATFETSRYNEWGDARDDFGLKDLFGVSSAGQIVGPAGNSYMRIERAHPILAGFEGTTILPGPEYRLTVKKTSTSPFDLSVIPAYPAFPPEMVYTETASTDQPAGTFLENGASRVVFFPGDIDRTFHRSGHPDFSRLLIQSVCWLLNGRKTPVSVDGKGMLEIFAWKTEPGFALHVLNYTHPWVYRAYVSGFHAVGPLQARFEIPTGRTVQSVRALRENRELAFQRKADAVHFEIPTVVDYEVVALT
jgi:Hypothetical glycosyl hydrolase 6/Beta-galactosidase trimerisation domain